MTTRTAIRPRLADFSHTLTFATSGPVFNLPDGYSANSVEAGIRDNAFVPEPATFSLVGIGLVGLLRGAVERGR